MSKKSKRLEFLEEKIHTVIQQIALINRAMQVLINENTAMNAASAVSSAQAGLLFDLVENRFMGDNAALNAAITDSAYNDKLAEYIKIATEIREKVNQSSLAALDDSDTLDPNLRKMLADARAEIEPHVNASTAAPVAAEELPGTVTSQNAPQAPSTPRMAADAAFPMRIGVICPTDLNKFDAEKSLSLLRSDFAVMLDLGLNTGRLTPLEVEKLLEVITEDWMADTTPKFPDCAIIDCEGFKEFLNTLPTTSVAEFNLPATENLPNAITVCFCTNVMKLMFLKIYGRMPNAA